jgi:hypothetical protein
MALLRTAVDDLPLVYAGVVGEGWYPMCGNRQYQWVPMWENRTVCSHTVSTVKKSVASN